MKVFEKFLNTWSNVFSDNSPRFGPTTPKICLYVNDIFVSNNVSQIFEIFFRSRLNDNYIFNELTLYLVGQND